MIAGDTRGTSVISWFEADDSDDGISNGTAYESVAEAPLDVAAWATLARTDRIVLSGHSLGASKVILAAAADTIGIEALVLIAPADMVAYFQRSSDHALLAADARAAVERGEPSKLLLGYGNGWIMSAATVLTYAECGVVGDVVCGSEVRSTGAAASITVPTLIVTGSEDLAMIIDPGKGCEVLKQTLETSSPAVDLVEIAGGDHCFTTSDTGDQLAKTVLNWIAQMLVG